MGRRKKQLEPFDSERFFNENRELCLKYMSKETANLDVNDIDLPQEMTYDRRMGIPSAKCDYSAMTILQKLEYIKCKNDLLYFTQKYITILSLDDGEIKFNLWDYQKELLKSFQANRFVLSVQSRQSGKTQTTAAYIAWRANFHAGKKIAILANKFAQAKEIMARVNLSFERLPTFLKKPVKSMSKQNLEFEDLTEIFAAASDGSGIRGRSVTDLYWDEAAFTNNDNEFWESNYPVIASGKTSRIIVTSTPNGAKGVFYNLYKGGLEDIDETGVGKNKFKVLEVPYTRVPKYNNEEFRLDTIARIGQDSFEQEFSCSFAGATGALIASAVLAIIKRKEPINIKELVKKEEPTLRVFEKPIKDHKYIITVDTARGLGLDYSAFVVFDVTKLPYKVVASYRNNLIPTSLYPLHIVNAARDYNSAYLLIEMNDLGFQIAEDIYETYEYDNLFRVFTDKKTKSQKIGWFVDSQLGVKTSVATKKTGCANIKSLIETFKLELNDPIIIDEFSTFVRVGNSYEADAGCNDDFAMCCVLFGWAVGQQHVIEMIESNFKTQMIEDYKEEHSDLLPLAFSVIDGLDEPISNNGYREVTPQMMQDAFFNGF